jgi:hypothetical protein
LSHSSKDAKTVNKFRDLILQGGLDFNLNDVKFTSAEDMGLAGGINIPEDLRLFMQQKMGLFIQFLSDNYGNSRVCLNEEGAGWCLVTDLMFIPMIVPPATSANIPWIKKTNKGINLYQKGSILNIYQDRKDFWQ